ncbi:MAG: hypothetical protein K2I43_08885, partial [Alistipes sp.]|nr:hypothetical protein [Alistipes sp.]
MLNAVESAEIPKIRVFRKFGYFSCVIRITLRIFATFCENNGIFSGKVVKKNSEYRKNAFLGNTMY